MMYCRKEPQILTLVNENPEANKRKNNSFKYLTYTEMKKIFVTVRTVVGRIEKIVVCVLTVN